MDTDYTCEDSDEEDEQTLKKLPGLQHLNIFLLQNNSIIKECIIEYMLNKNNLHSYYLFTYKLRKNSPTKSHNERIM